MHFSTCLGVEIHIYFARQQLQGSTAMHPGQLATLEYQLPDAEIDCCRRHIGDILRNLVRTAVPAHITK
jgi:hypothetical protein